MANDRWLHLVAEVDGIVVGSAELKRETHRLLAHRTEWTGVVVCGAYQGRGIARALLEEALAQAASWGIELLTVGVRGGTPPKRSIIAWASASTLVSRVGSRKCATVNCSSSTM